jgi:hypothetical protein
MSESATIAAKTLGAVTDAVKGAVCADLSALEAGREPGKVGELLDSLHGSFKHPQRRFARALHAIGADTLAQRIEAGISDTPNQKMAVATVKRTAMLKSVGNWLVKEAHKQIAILEPKLLTLAGQATEKNLDATFAKAAAATTKTFNALKKDLDRKLSELGDILDDHGQQDLAEHHGVKREDAKLGDIGETSVLGAPLSDHLDYIANTLLFRFKAAVRSGVENGDTAAEIRQRVAGGPVTAGHAGHSHALEAADIAPTPANADKSLQIGIRLFDGTENSLEKVIHAAINAVQNAVEMLGAEELPEDDDEDANPDEKQIIYVWLAVMDANTCPYCEHLDGQMWDQDNEPIGDADEYPGDPPAHWGCRCSLVPQDAAEPPATGSFSDYLDKFTDKELEQAFGKGAYANWQRGDISDAQLIGQKDNLLTLEQLRNTRLGGGE